MTITFDYQARFAGSLAASVAAVGLGVLISAPGASAAARSLLPTSAVASAEMTETSFPNVPVVAPVASPCTSAGHRLQAVLARVSSGDWLAADEAAAVAEILLRQCGWLEVQTTEGYR